jgi:hypothetical protein
VKTREPSEREHARLRCREVLAGTSNDVRSLLVEMERDTATLILAAGDQPLFIWRLDACGDTDRLLDEARIPALAGSAQRFIVTRWAPAPGSAPFGLAICSKLLRSRATPCTQRSNDSAAFAPLPGHAEHQLALLGDSGIERRRAGAGDVRRWGES